MVTALCCKCFRRTSVTSNYSFPGTASSLLSIALASLSAVPFYHGLALRSSDIFYTACLISPYAETPLAMPLLVSLETRAISKPQFSIYPVKAYTASVCFPDYQGWFHHWFLPLLRFEHSALVSWLAVYRFSREILNLSSQEGFFRMTCTVTFLGTVSYFRRIMPLVLQCCSWRSVSSFYCSILDWSLVTSAFDSLPLEVNQCDATRPPCKI